MNLICRHCGDTGGRTGGCSYSPTRMHILMEATGDYACAFCGVSWKGIIKGGSCAYAQFHKFIPSKPNHTCIYCGTKHGKFLKGGLCANSPTKYHEFI